MNPLAHPGFRFYQILRDELKPTWVPFSEIVNPLAHPGFRFYQILRYELEPTLVPSPHGECPNRGSGLETREPEAQKTKAELSTENLHTSRGVVSG